MMQSLTALVLAAFAAYAGAWYLGKVDGNFALLLFLATLVTGVYWLAERFYFLPQRQSSALALESQRVHRRADLERMGVSQVDGALSSDKSSALAQPWWLDWTAGLFPVILMVFLLRSFLFEPFKIPSGSMIPTLIEGDFILVNKFTYGIRIPIINRKVVEIGQPKRGDVMVFRYPMDPSLDYIKRATRAGMQMDLTSAIEFERFLVTAIYGTEDKNEGIGAFLQKREASFKGR